MKSKTVNGFEKYRVNEDGQVLLKSGRWSNGSADKDGYRQVSLFNGKEKKVKIHRLVAIAFIPNLENKPQVNHINGIKHDNRVENLEWVTGSENAKHALSTGLRVPAGPSGEASRTAKLTNEKVLKIRELFRSKENTRIELSEMFNVSPVSISYVILKRTWKHI